MREAIQSPDASLPAGPYSQGIRVGDLLFISGQGPFDPNGAKLGETFAEQCEATFDNLGILARAGGSDLEHMVRLGAFLRTLDDFPEFNRIMEARLTPPFPARTTVPVELPGFDIELDAVFYVPGEG